MATNRAFPSPAEIADSGQRIYDEHYRAEFEKQHFGKYVAINVRDGTVVIGDTPEEALEQARRAKPTGIFHLIRVGFPSVYSGSAQVAHDRKDWVFGL